MARTYSQDLRDAVLDAYDRGIQTKQIVETFGVSPAWARRVKQVRRETGRTTPLPRGCGGKVFKIDMQRLAELVEQQPDATLRELRDRLEVEVSETAVWLALKRLGLTYKKRRSTRPNRIVRTSLNAAVTGARNSPGVMPGG